MTGSGNDFVMLDARVSTPADWTAEDMQAICAQGTGVGADGVVFVGPGSRPGSARMVYFNADGSHAAMCGNAALCSTTLAARLGVAPAAGMDLETDAGTYRSRTTEPGRAELNLAPVDPPAAVTRLQLAPGERQAVLGRVGVPHLVVLVEDVDDLDLMERGRALRFDPALAPEGANINFISNGSGTAESPVWRMRTYERGVEGETLACGTGAVAAAVLAGLLGKVSSPVTLKTRGGPPLGVSFTLDGQRVMSVTLTGEARLVYEGALTPEALR